jgi:O-antigen ligase
VALGVWIKSAKSSLTGGFIGAVSGVLLICFALFLVGGHHVAERMTETNLQSTDRAQFLAAYWPTIKASPWLGYGLGAFRSFNAASMNTQNAVTLADQGAAHSVYLQWLLQVGWPGALAMFGAVALVWAMTARGILRRASQHSIGLACLGVGVVYAVHGLTDFAFEIPSMAAFFSAFLGLGYGLAERPTRRRVR